ncbi:MAG: hypothetical protein J7M25_07490 [Deltaproteobacteria bacterium]|nr:hypothetical protein [Deltaproteobacteria bacterium]
MIALAILVMALVVVAEADMGATQDTSRAKMMSVAAMLARAKMSEIEFDMRHDGFSEFEEEECGDFGDDDYGDMGRFHWCYTIEKIELPENLDMQKIMGGQQQDGSKDEDDEKKPEGSSPGGGLMDMLGGMGGLMGGMLGGKGGLSGMSGGMGSMAGMLLASQFGIIQKVIEQAIRRIILTVSWPESGHDRELTVVLYVTNPAVLDQSLMTPGSMGGAGGMGSFGKSAGSGSGASSKGKK